MSKLMSEQVYIDLETNTWNIFFIFVVDTSWDSEQTMHSWEDRETTSQKYVQNGV